MFKRIIASVVCLTFIFSNLQYVGAQDFSINQLPVPGSMIGTTPAFVPLTLKGLIVHPENALKFDFLMDTGHSHLTGDDLSDEALKIMKYFLTALTIPEDDLWVNLSPYEKGRIVQDNFGQTIMGRDLLAQDYVLKQLTASLIYPEKALGKEFWQQVYSKASEEFGTTQIPVNTFNKVWIVPSEAVVWEHEGKVLIVKSHLKVMLEEDYLSLNKHVGVTDAPKDVNKLGSQIVRAIVLPVLEKEVNEGKNFAQLRQMYQAMILATWYKKALKESILNKVYANQKKTKGVDDINAGDVESIYQQYLKAFKKGAFNYIKEDIDPSTGQTVPRKYFSGGFSLKNGLITLAMALTVLTTFNPPAGIAQSTGNTIRATWKITEVGSGASADVVKQFEQTKDAAMLTNMRIEATKILISKDNVNTIVNKLNDADYIVHQAAFRAIEDKLLKDPQASRDEKVRILVIAMKSQHDDIHLLAENWMVKLNGKELLLEMLNSDAMKYRKIAMDGLDILVTDPQEKASILEKASESGGSIKWRRLPYEELGTWSSNKDVREWQSQGLKELDPYLKTMKLARSFIAMEGVVPVGEIDQKIVTIEEINSKIDKDITMPLLLQVLRKFLSSSSVEEQLGAASLIYTLYLGTTDHRTPDLVEAFKEASELIGGPNLGAAGKEFSEKEKEDSEKEIRKMAKKILDYRLEQEIIVVRQKSKQEPGQQANAAGQVTLQTPEESRDAAMLINTKMIAIAAWKVTGNLDMLMNTISNANDKKVYNAAQDAVRDLMDDPRKKFSISQMLEMLKSDYYLSAEERLKGLGASKEEMIDGYIAALSSKRLGSPENAARKLGSEEFRDKRSVQPLIDALDYKLPSTSTNSAIIESLGNLEDRSAVRPILNLYSDNKGAAINRTIEAALDKLGIDQAMLQTPAQQTVLAKNPNDLGGIALDANMLDLQIKRDGNGVPLPISQQPLDQMNIQGFVPQIISIQPVDLPALLGLDTAS